MVWRIHWARFTTLHTVLRTPSCYRMSCAITLTLPVKYRDIARVMGVKVEGMSTEEARNAAVEAVFALNRDVGIPPHLRDVGVRKEDIPALAQAALDDVCTGGNPREATLEDIVELYHTAQ